MGLSSAHGVARANVQDRPSHWSKDFVEHLRTVHFALVLVTLILVVTALDNESSRLNTALMQIEEINSFKNQWSNVPSNVYSMLLKRSDFIIGIQTGNEKWLYDVVPVDATTDDWRFSFSSTLESYDQGVFPKELNTLADFKHFWNSLTARPFVHFIDKLTDCKYRKESPQIHACSFVVPTINTDSLDAKATVTRFLSRGSYLTLTHVTSPERPIPPKTEFAMGIDTSLERFDEEVLTKSYFRGTRKGTFEEAFPELSAVSSDIAIIPIDEAVSRLNSRAASSEKNVSLLGFNVPISQLSQWGILVVLAIQFYMWLHLHELAKRIEPNADGWDVAWIGVYRTRAAVFAAVISCFAMPLAASMTLAHRLAQIPFYYRRTVIAMSICAVVLSAGLGLLTLWRLVLLRRCLPVKPQNAESDAV